MRSRIRRLAGTALLIVGSVACTAAKDPVKINKDKFLPLYRAGTKLLVLLESPTEPRRADVERAGHDLETESKVALSVAVTTDEIALALTYQEATMALDLYFLQTDEAKVTRDPRATAGAEASLQRLKDALNAADRLWHGVRRSSKLAR